MIERKYGRIVNISADSVHTGLHSHAGYNAAKGGVNGLTTGLAFEFAKYNITVNCVSPGGIMTPEIRQMLDPNSDVYKKHRIVMYAPSWHRYRSAVWSICTKWPHWPLSYLRGVEVHHRPDLQRQRRPVDDGWRRRPCAAR